MDSALILNVNGVDHELDVDPSTPLLEVLRETLGLKGAKLGCGLEQCYACAVIVDGVVRPSCATGVDAFVGCEIVTVEGIGSPDSLHPVQRAFLRHDAPNRLIR